jgi:ABC-type molybdate transport system substrate-binding protein
MRSTLLASLALAAALVVGAASRAAADDALVLYGAGSLREAMTEMASLFERAHGIAVRGEFGASGRMRERIEAGDKVDLFTSADIGHALKLVKDGRASVMAMFAQNALCLLAPAQAGTAASPLDAMLKDGVRIGVSPAKIDPLGDYTVELFEVADGLRKGSGAALQARAVTIDSPPGTPPAKSGDYVLDALRDGKIDLAIVYCSGRARFARLDPSLTISEFPSELSVGPQYGLAVLKDAKPPALLLALTILSPEGQAVLAKAGFKPIGLPAGQ